jgi:hypothetical protein
MESRAALKITTLRSSQSAGVRQTAAEKRSAMEGELLRTFLGQSIAQHRPVGQSLYGN